MATGNMKPDSGPLRRILYVSATDTTHDRRFLAAIVRQYGEAWFALLGDQAKTSAITVPAGVHRWPLSLREITAWREELGRAGIDLVHAGPLDSIVPRIACALALPLVAMSWGSDLLYRIARDEESRARLIAAFPFIDGLVADCACVAAAFDDLAGGNTIERAVFPWGIERARFVSLPREASKRMRGEWGWENSQVLLSTRRWAPLYNVGNLVAAFARLRQRHRSLKLILMGDGPLREEIEGAITALGLQEHVRCPGVVPEHDLPRWYAAADLYVSPALCDGSSISLLEAMAAGLPAVAHEAYGNREWITPGVNGWLIDCSSSGSIADALDGILHAPLAAEAVRAHNDRLIAARADWDRNVTSLFDLYERARRRHTARLQETDHAG